MNLYIRRLFVILIILLSIIHLNLPASAVDVGGIISQDTTWVDIFELYLHAFR